MKEICQNCANCRPSYKGGKCSETGKKVKITKDTCDNWRPRRK